ncbi:2711_t:CDS:2 [Dentiscutata erythropus]|uniref:2711_t:CDS:1 n=1 Tax=Dentiscutata erythropus TaxID=1348616 RepID=A0A9N9CGR5_9GLOM|nr:2711_t:CDS:2 [Dentiscutata erythropus]
MSKENKSIQDNTIEKALKIIPSYVGPTSANEELCLEIELFNKRVKNLESELKLYKNPSTSLFTGDQEGAEARNSQAEEERKRLYKDGITTY